MMGRQTVCVEVHASLSRHNSEQDAKDDAAWEDLRSRIAELVAEPKYADISVWC